MAKRPNTKVPPRSKGADAPPTTTRAAPSTAQTSTGRAHHGARSQPSGVRGEMGGVVGLPKKHGGGGRGHGKHVRRQFSTNKHRAAVNYTAAAGVKATAVLGPKSIRGWGSGTQLAAPNTGLTGLHRRVAVQTPRKNEPGG